MDAACGRGLNEGWIGVQALWPAAKRFPLLSAHLLLMEGNT
jgi:hypothetical protein